MSMRREMLTVKVRIDLVFDPGRRDEAVRAGLDLVSSQARVNGGGYSATLGKHSPEVLSVGPDTRSRHARKGRVK